MISSSTLPHAWCIAWDGSKYLAGKFDDIKNVNAGLAMDKKPGLAITRSDLTEAQALRIVQGFNAQGAPA